MSTSIQYVPCFDWLILSFEYETRMFYDFVYVSISNIHLYNFVYVSNSNIKCYDFTCACPLATFEFLSLHIHIIHVYVFYLLRYSFLFAFCLFVYVICIKTDVHKKYNVILMIKIVYIKES